MRIKSTTILAVKRFGKVAIGGDGQVTHGTTVLKANAKKIRTISGGKVLTGFAGSTADAFTLFEKFEAKLEEYGGNLVRASVELAKEWRSDKFLRKLEAMLIVASKDHVLTLSGNGDVIESDDGIMAIGSGGPFAAAAARALLRKTELSAREIVQESMTIAAETCIYTNSHLIIEEA